MKNTETKEEVKELISEFEKVLEKLNKDDDDSYLNSEEYEELNNTLVEKSLEYFDWEMEPHYSFFLKATATEATKYNIEQLKIVIE